MIADKNDRKRVRLQPAESSSHCPVNGQTPLGNRNGHKDHTKFRFQYTNLFRFQYTNLFGMEYPHLALLCDSAAITLNELISTLVDCVSYSLEPVQISNDSSYLDSTLDDLVEVFDSTVPALNNAIYQAGHHLMYTINFCKARVKLIKLVKLDESDIFIVTYSGE